MARKPDPKPLFALKGDFYASLDRFTQEALQLLSAVDMAIRAGAVSDTAKPILEERTAALRKAMIEDEPT